MRLSLGSAIRLNLIKADQLTEPTTCYILVGDRCKNNCLFCSQNIDNSKLSRIEWYEFEEKEIIKRIKKSDFKRVCLQCTSTTIDEVKDIVEKINKPVSISYNFENIDQIKNITKQADRICIPLDVANKELYKEIKNNDYNKKLNLIKKAAELYPNKITTHLILGLGESENELMNLIRELHKLNIEIGLFAFTPIKGTKLENQPQPDINYYRRIQSGYYKLKHNKTTRQAFRTAGCKDCNRPYYNEKPGRTIYNYPRELTDEEYELAINNRQ